MEWKLQTDSYTYADFIFQDGNVRRFYSLDWAHKYSRQRDRELGLKRLRRLISKHGPLTERALVCENDGTHKLLERYERGIRIE
jgi:hypothetical protein